MKFSALTLAAVMMMTLGVYAQDNTTAGNDTTPAGNDTTPGGNTTAPGGNSTTNDTTPGGNNTGNSTDGAPKPTGSSAAFAIAAGSQGVVAAGVFAGLLAALV